jgi:DNA-binding NtrC family response regulator
MHTEEAARTVIVVCAEPGIEKEVVAGAVRVRWLHSIKAAIALLKSAPGETFVITELALRDGNWRDLIEEVRRLGKPVPVALASPTSTSELWWDALECGIEDILLAPLTVARIQEYLDKSFPNKNGNAQL